MVIAAFISPLQSCLCGALGPLRRTGGVMPRVSARYLRRLLIVLHSHVYDEELGGHMSIKRNQDVFTCHTPKVSLKPAISNFQAAIGFTPPSFGRPFSRGLVDHGLHCKFDQQRQGKILRGFSSWRHGHGSKDCLQTLSAGLHSKETVQQPADSTKKLLQVYVFATFVGWGKNALVDQIQGTDSAERGEMCRIYHFRSPCFT